MKKILIVSYYFPPIGSSGTVRISNFVKYLHKYDWTCHVLTVKNIFHHAIDDTYIHDVEKASQVHRTFHIEPRSFYRQSHDYSLNIKPSRIKRNIIKFFRFLIKLFLVPDEIILWSPFAIIKGIYIIYKYNIDIIFSSSPPPTVHIIAYFLKIFTGKKLVVDFRDEWINDPFSSMPTSVHRRINLYLENRILQKADAIVAVTPTIFEEMNTQYHHKFRTITNGYDPEDFQIGPHASDPTKKLTFYYPGTFYKHRTPFYFLQALLLLLKDQKINKDEISVIFQGNISPDTYNQYILNNHELLEIIKIRPYADHPTVIKNMISADILLLVISTQSGLGSLSGKIFEYIATGKPILGLVPANGAAASLIRKTQTGIVVSPENISDIYNSIYELYKRWNKSSLQIYPHKPLIKKYSRESQTKLLIRVFQSHI